MICKDLAVFGSTQIYTQFHSVSGLGPIGKRRNFLRETPFQLLPPGLAAQSSFFPSFQNCAQRDFWNPAVVDVLDSRHLLRKVWNDEAEELTPPWAEGRRRFNCFLLGSPRNPAFFRHSRIARSATSGIQLSLMFWIPDICYAKSGMTKQRNSRRLRRKRGCVHAQLAGLVNQFQQILLGQVE